MFGHSVTLPKNKEITLKGGLNGKNVPSPSYRQEAPEKIDERKNKASKEVSGRKEGQDQSLPSPKQDSNVKEPQPGKGKKRPWQNLPFLTKRHYGGFEPANDNSEDADREEEMFDDVVKRSRTILFHVKSIFPFDLFPNELIIDITKVTVVSRSFFMSGHTQSIHIRDIMDVRVEMGPFFSSMTILDLGYIQGNKLFIKYLKRKDAVRARQIIEGLIAATKAGVDLTKIPRRELISRLPELLQSQRLPLP